MKKWFGIAATTFLLSGSFIGSVSAAESDLVKSQLLNLQEEGLFDGEEDYQPFIELEPNNSFTQANDITDAIEVTGSLTVNDEDYFKLEVPAKSALYLVGITENEGDQVSAFLYDADFNPINDGGSVEDNYFYDDRVLAKGGTYYIKLKNDNQNSNIVNYSFNAFTAEGDVSRMSGADRYETAVQVATEGFGYAEEIILATGEDFPDALAAGPLAADRQAPILLTRKNELPKSVRDFILDFGVTKVTIVGGTGVVSQKVQDDLKNNLGIEVVTRIAGQDRFETAAKIAEQVSPDFDNVQVFVVNGRNFPDALSAAPMAAALGAPILLTETKSMPKVTADAVKQYEETFVVGGDGVVSDAIFASLKTTSDVTRISGINRYETSKAVAEYFGEYFGAISYGAYVTTGEAFPDALAASALAGLTGQPIILTTPNDLHDSARKYFETNQVLWYTIVGGTGAVSSSIEKELKSMVQ